MTAVALGIAGAVSVLVVCWVSGTGLCPRADQAERLSAGVGSLLAIAWLTTVQPLVRISLLGHRWLTLAVGMLMLAGLAYRGRAALMPNDLRWRPLLATAAPALLLFAPLIRVHSATMPLPDMRWHEGWIRELGAGELAPAGPYDGVPNGYPWLYHSLGSWLELLPGGMTQVFWAQQALVVIAAAAGIWLLARETGLGESESSWSIFLALGAAGVGWLWIHTPTAVPYTNAKVYDYLHGDFIVSAAVSPSLGLLPPVMPRDMALGLTPMALWGALRCARSRSRWLGLAVGAMVGALLLIGPIAAVVVTVTAVVLQFVYRAGIVVLAATAVGAGIVLAVWLAPFAVRYVKLGGVIGKTAKDSVGVQDGVTGLGVIVPLAVVGLVIAHRSSGRVDRRALAVIIVVPLAIWLAGLAMSGRSLIGIAPLVRSQRYVPLVGLALTLPAGLAAGTAMRAVRRGGPAVAVFVAAMCCTSLILTSLGLAHVMRNSKRESLFACDPSVRFSPTDTIVVAGRRKPFNAVEDDVFRATGAYLLYRKPPAQIRFRSTFRHTYSQLQRREWAEDVASGIIVPQADWALAYADAPITRFGNPVATCTAGGLGGQIKLLLYRMPA